MSTPGAPDFTGNQNISQQSLNTVDTTATIKANEANQFDADIDNYDLVAEDGYSSNEQNISGANEVVIRAASQYDMSVIVEWTDGSDNVLYAEQPQAATNVTDFKGLYPVGSTHVNVRIVDESSNGENKVDATVNAH